MNDKLKNIIQKTKQVFQQTSEQIITMINSNNVSVEELISFIKNHEDTRVKSEELLGITFNHYKLNYEKYHFLLETRTMDKREYILTFKLSTNHRSIIKYNSYNSNHKKDGLIRIPSFIN
ncbi:hypothetical protein EJF36_11900 [Bacillus sp. HMF5848]|uniref:hypothetical protein n=1 Tax=Bacillus sp. HMF5848 TaxID=2495421 RepID=UPI000F7AF7EB|nr:hypothetical protein [Bacillus sp. HMF5848]RSK27523.1 hypothetical protein EJF36_11900 [Bacillus sp. HMF5848]